MNTEFYSENFAGFYDSKKTELSCGHNLEEVKYGTSAVVFPTWP
jgi:hypothetical protein